MSPTPSNTVPFCAGAYLLQPPLCFQSALRCSKYVRTAKYRHVCRDTPPRPPPLVAQERVMREEWGRLRQNGRQEENV